MNKELSNCCKTEVKIGGDDKEGTHYYICTKCNKPCDLYSEIKELSDVELIEEHREFNCSADIHKIDIEKELLKRLSKDNWKKELIENIEKEIPDDWTYHDGITIKNVVKGIINNLK